MTMDYGKNRICNHTVSHILDNALSGRHDATITINNLLVTFDSYTIENVIGTYTLTLMRYDKRIASIPIGNITTIYAL